MILKLNPENENFMLFEDKLNEVIDAINALTNPEPYRVHTYPRPSDPIKDVKDAVKLANPSRFTSGGKNYAGTQKVCRKCGEVVE